MSDTPDSADYLRAAITYALNHDDGLEWLRAWNEGGPEEMAELEAVMHAEAKQEEQRQRLALTKLCLDCRWRHSDGDAPCGKFFSATTIFAARGICKGVFHEMKVKQ